MGDGREGAAVGADERPRAAAAAAAPSAPSAPHRHLARVFFVHGGPLLQPPQHRADAAGRQCRDLAAAAHAARRVCGPPRRPLQARGLHRPLARRFRVLQDARRQLGGHRHRRARPAVHDRRDWGPVLRLGRQGDRAVRGACAFSYAAIRVAGAWVWVGGYDRARALHCCFWPLLRDGRGSAAVGVPPPPRRSPLPPALSPPK